MKSINPFEDPSFKKAILGDDLIGKEMSSEMAEIIDNVPALSDTARNVIIDASAIAKNKNEQKAQEMTLALNNVFTEYNKKYDLDLSIDFSSFSRTLLNVSSPEKRHVLELYVSEVFKSIKPILILHMMQRLSLIIDTILDPNKLFNSDLSTADLFLACEKLMDFMVRLDDMRKDIVIPGADLELKKISESKGENFDTEENREMINEFMKLLKKDSGIE